MEIWYPATSGTGKTDIAACSKIFTRDGKTLVDLFGRAVRSAESAAAGAPWPLAIISHGYPGNQYLLSHLAENLASKGYVVASIDHKDSTYNEQTAFGSTLPNRPLDILFLLNSMGGYGVVNTLGGGFTPPRPAPRSIPESGPGRT